ncbi:MAG: imidazole glycerol phosphate synthase cyclase subunit [Desulfobacteraceae bacterium]|nr:imidazole glycerol phosphate synthase cyclase subunit [Desulfobacteraceae bacterium]
MLKVRVIPTLLYKNFGLVKGERFNSWRRVGTALQSVNVYSIREVDELVFLDITATEEKRQPDFEIIDDLTDECFMPFTAGGGIRNIEDIHGLLRVGADKVAINSAAVVSPGLIRDAARRFGAQCVIVSIDFKKYRDDGYEVFINSGKTATGLTPLELAKEAEELGAGEILLTSIDRDGTMSGYELDCIRQVSEAISIPVIASGGAGCPQHFYEAITIGKASAVAAASVFHFTELTPLDVKHYLHQHDIPVRLPDTEPK